MTDPTAVIAAALEEELGWDWEAEDDGDVCSHGGPVRVPSSREIIDDIAIAVTKAITAEFVLTPRSSFTNHVQY